MFACLTNDSYVLDWFSAKSTAFLYKHMRHLSIVLIENVGGAVVKIYLDINSKPLACNSSYLAHWTMKHTSHEPIKHYILVD